MQHNFKFKVKHSSFLECQKAFSINWGGWGGGGGGGGKSVCVCVRERERLLLLAHKDHLL